jgi:hypothetical protein
MMFSEPIRASCSSCESCLIFFPKNEGADVTVTSYRGCAVFTLSFDNMHHERESSRMTHYCPDDRQNRRKMLSFAPTNFVVKGAPCLMSRLPIEPVLVKPGHHVRFTREVEEFLRAYGEAGLFNSMQELIKHIVRQRYKQDSDDLPVSADVPDMAEQSHHVRFTADLEQFIQDFAAAHALGSKPEAVKQIVREFYFAQLAQRKKKRD